MRRQLTRGQNEIVVMSRLPATENAIDEVEEVSLQTDKAEESDGMDAELPAAF